MKIKRPRIKPSISVIGRKLRGLIRSCDKCGAKKQELFKMRSFSKSGEENISYYCSRCYSKILRRPKEI